MTLNPTLRGPLLLLAALAVSSCSELECVNTSLYQGAQLDKRLATPDGLQPLETNDSHTVPGGQPPADYVPQACLVRPPKLVETPKPNDD